MSENARSGIGAVLYCVFGLLAFAVQDAIVRHLSMDYPVLQVLTIRSFAVLGIALVICSVYQGGRLLRASHPLLLLSRGVLAFVAFTTYYLALTQIPFADGASVYMTGPLFVTALSAPILKEHIGLHRWMAVLIGFTAAVYMIGPGTDLFRLAAVLPLFSAVVYALIPIINRHVGLRDHALTMVLYAMIAYTFLCVSAGLVVHAMQAPTDSSGLLGNLLSHWSWPDRAATLWSMLSGIIFMLGLLGLTQSYRLLPVSVVAPFEYSYLVWAALLGWLVFAEVPGVRTLTGAVIIAACGCYIAFREHRLKSG